MAIDSWLPVGHRLPDGNRVRTAILEGCDWQMYELRDEGRALVVRESLFARWTQAGVLPDGVFEPCSFGGESLYSLLSGSEHVMEPLLGGSKPGNKSEAVALLHAWRATRKKLPESSVHDAIYVERLSLLLPTFSLSPPVKDDVVLGTWLTGGVPVSVRSPRRLRALVNWMESSQLSDLLSEAEFSSSKVDSQNPDGGLVQEAEAKKPRFELAGRPALEKFLIEHVIDIVENADRYKSFGIEFPSAMILFGPPGCGKTFAIDTLIDYLGWPSYAIEASSVASPYIHETSKKVAAVFEEAMKNAPSVLVIDEMEAFLADRTGASGHQIEEVAEFLRRIPEAIKNQVLVVAMTNQLDMIDPAIQRRGRFDHVVKVEMASEVEVEALLRKLVAALPHGGDTDFSGLSVKLRGRPLSDVAFLVREASRLAARGGATEVSQVHFQQALEGLSVRGEENKRKIGFV